MIVNGFRSKAAALRHLRAAGFNVCPMVTAGCIAACLHTAGNPAHMDGKATSRVSKTKAYMTERPAFMAALVFEIAAHARKAAREGMAAGIRLNATSDLPWERVRVEVDGVEHPNVMAIFPEVSFYDYTKVTKRAIAWGEGRMPGNYRLTFSRAESNDADVLRVLMAGGNVSVVMAAPVYKATLARNVAHLPVAGGHIEWSVTDGDAHDYRPADPKGCIVALKAKGDARQDTSGFVLR